MRSRALSLSILLVASVLSLPAHEPQSEQPLRLAIAGLVHGHVSGFLRGAQGRTDVQIVGIYDPEYLGEGCGRDAGGSSKCLRAVKAFHDSNASGAKAPGP